MYVHVSIKLSCWDLSHSLNRSFIDIVFIGPMGSGKSSLIGSLYRAVNEVAEFPEKVQLVLHHPDEDSHGTMHWLETRGNPRGTVVFQDTRGDQVSARNAANDGKKSCSQSDGGLSFRTVSFPKCNLSPWCNFTIS